jgi:hypothetical protein
MPKILNTTPIVVPNTAVRKLPMTVVLTSAYASRSIQYQPDPNNTANLISVTPDTTTATQLVAVNNSPVAAIVITGQAGDTYELIEGR